jgi:hypothetical protein
LPKMTRFNWARTASICERTTLLGAFTAFIGL